MVLDVEKGQKVDLTKNNPGLNKIRVGLGWDVNKFQGAAFDLDAFALLLDANGKLPNENKDVVYFNNKKHDSGAVVHSGDNLTGQGSGDDECITIDLAKVPANIAKIVCAVAIYKFAERKQNFGMVENSYIRLIDLDKNADIVKFNLGEDFSTETTVVAGEIYRNGAEWKFSAVGAGKIGGIKELAAVYA